MSGRIGMRQLSWPMMRQRVRYRALMSDRNRRFLLRERPSGRIGPDTFELSEEAVPYAVGQTVQGLVGWQEYAVASDANPLFPVDVAEGVSPSAYMGALGMTGLTAWVGIRDIGKPQPGETVVGSAAAGAVGSVAGQRAKADGARVVGIAGGPEKCALLTDELGFDAAVDHRADDWAAQLAAATPNGIDVDFENVGGDIMDAVFARLNIGARV